MAIIKKAGAIILSQANPELIVLIYRDKQKDWSFPKGHIEDEEEIAETTCREVKEETGLLVKLLSELPLMEYNHPAGDMVAVHMFLTQSENDSALRPEALGDKVVWVNFKEVYEKLSYDNIKNYYKTVLPEIEKIIAKLKSDKHLT